MHVHLLYFQGQLIGLYQTFRRAREKMEEHAHRLLQRISPSGISPMVLYLDQWNNETHDTRTSFRLHQRIVVDWGRFYEEEGERGVPCVAIPMTRFAISTDSDSELST